MVEKFYEVSEVVSSDDDETEEKSLRKRTKLESFVFLIGTAINFGVMWRFTYVMHKDGGAIFIVPYFVMMILIGLPLCCLDMTLGWCSKLGAVRVWQLTKISAGVGFALVGIAALVATYTGVIISWAFFYFFSSFRKDLPWTCKSSKYMRNSDNCTRIFNMNTSHSNWTTSNMAENELTSSESFFLRRVVNVNSEFNLESFSDFKYSMVTCLAFTWICTCIILGKGVRSAHRLAFLGAILVTLMLCLTVGTTIKENGYENIKRFLSVRWSELLSVEPWYDGMAQVLFSLGPGYGWLITITNNKSYSSNCFTDCYLIVILQSIFSVLLTCVIVIVTGAQTSAFQHFDVNQSDIGYVFVLFAAHLARIPGSCLWCAVFFLGMALMGLAANAYFVFGIYHWILSIDCRWSCQYKKFFTAIAIAAVLFSIGLVLITSGGYLVLRAIDQRVTELSASSIAILECLIIGWLYGGKKFISIVEAVTGHKSRIPWRLMWEFVTPVVIVSILLSKWVNDDHDDDQVSHKASFIIGRIAADMPVIFIPLYAIILFLVTCFGTNKRVGQLFSSSHNWAPISRIEKNNSYALSKLNKRHYGESEPVLMVRIEDPAFGEIPHGFFYHPNQKNITEILQTLPLLQPHMDSTEEYSKNNANGRNQLNRRPHLNMSSRCPKVKQDSNINLDYSLISDDGSTPMIVSRRMPYPAALSLTSLPSLVILPPHGVWSSDELPSFAHQMSIPTIDPQMWNEDM